MAIVVSTNLVDSTRQQWLEDIITCKYVMNGITYKGEIQEKQIVGEAARFNIGITKRGQESGEDTITKVMLYRRNGEQAVEINGTFKKKALQGRFFRFDLILKEG